MKKEYRASKVISNGPQSLERIRKYLETAVNPISSSPTEYYLKSYHYTILKDEYEILLEQILDKSVIEVNLENIKPSKIEELCFEGCTNLKKVTGYATRWYTGALYQCNNIEELELGQIGASDLRLGSLFQTTSAVDNSAVPSTLRKITYTNDDVWGFSNCTNLQEVYLPNATSISGSAFQNCSSLYIVSMPNVDYIDSYAFKGCTKLTSVYLPNATGGIDSNAFENCTSLSEVTLSNITSMANGVFTNCNNLKKLTIALVEGESILDSFVGGSYSPSFQYISSLFGGVTADHNETYCNVRELVITKGDALGLFALRNCTSLDSLTIPSTIQSIGDYALDGCKYLKDFTFEGTTAQWNSISKGNYWNRNLGALYVQCSDGQVAI